MNAHKNITPQDVLVFLRGCKVMTIATVTINNTPEAAIVYYVVDDDFTFYFFTTTGTRKYLNISQNQSVALAVNNMKSLITVQAEGKAEKVTDKKQVERIISMLKAVIAEDKKFGPPPVAKLEQGYITLLQIKPKWLRWADFNGFLHKSEKEYFQTIITDGNLITDMEI